MFLHDTAPTQVYTLSLHDALPIFGDIAFRPIGPRTGVYAEPAVVDRAAAEFSEVDHMVATAERLRSEEHTSELQSPCNLVCPLPLAKKKKRSQKSRMTTYRVENDE